MVLKNISNDTPSKISGITSGKYISPEKNFLPLNFKFSSDRAAKIPITVDIIVVIPPNINVFLSAGNISLSPSMFV
jgi:hypothetical protein